MATNRLPKGWRRGHEEDLACPHRDVSVCPDCARRPEVVEAAGRHYWYADPTERAAVVAEIAAIKAKYEAHAP